MIARELNRGFGFAGVVDEMEDATIDQHWMREALLASMAAAGVSNPNPAVGCVIVHDDRVIARGCTEAYGGRHAERVALANLDRSRLVDATAYVTLEPCAHFGHQPPCVDALVDSPIGRVVVACEDPDRRVNGRGLARLRAAGKQVEVGCLDVECAAWNFSFLAERLLRRPIFAIGWGESDTYFARLRARYDAPTKRERRQSVFVEGDDVFMSAYLDAGLCDVLHVVGETPPSVRFPLRRMASFTIGGERITEWVPESLARRVFDGDRP